MKRILHVVPTLGSGGAERQLVDLVSTTCPERFSHLVCSLRQPDFFAPVIRQAGQRVEILNLRGKHPWLAAARRLRAIAREYQPDVIHSWLYDANLSARLALKLGEKIPLVTSLQAPDYDPSAIAAANWPPARTEVFRWIDRLSASWAGGHFVACSRFVEQSYRARLGIPAARMQVIYNSVDPRRLTCPPEAARRLRDEAGVPQDAFVYLNVGRLDPQKGHSYLLHAFRRVAASASNAYLVVVGDGPLRVPLANLAKELELDRRVLFLGVRKDIGACLEMADAFVFPSLFEGLGVALVEAMSKGLACLASRLPVLQEVLEEGKTGLFFTPAAEGELAEVMQRVLSDVDLRRRLGRQARQEAERRFHSQAVLPQWEHLYSRLSHGKMVAA